MNTLNPSYHLLLIDDDERLADLLRQYMIGFSITLENSTTPSDGLRKILSRSFDLVILDVMLPEMDGFEVCKKIREKSEIPIIMLTARGEVMDRVVGLELGADDYLAKPFEPRELVARIQRILKRSAQSSSHHEILRYDNLTIDSGLRVVKIDGGAIDLSTMEYKLIELLSRHPGKMFSRDAILNELKGIDADLYTRAVDVLVSRVRQKLKPIDCIKTVRGTGYVFVGRNS